MISLKKLQSLKTGTRQRKIIAILKDFERDCSEKNPVHPSFLLDIVSVSVNLDSLSSEEKRKIERYIDSAVQESSKENIPDKLCRLSNSVRHLLLRNMGKEPAEWDLVSPGDTPAVPGSRKILPFNIYLDDIRSPFNVGSIFRTGDSFGISKIYLSEDTASPDHPRAARSAMGCTGSVPWERGNMGFPRDLPVFALELGGTPVEQFDFPPEGTLIIGSEEVGVSPVLLDMADKSLGRVTVITGGTKGSLNVSVATGIVLHRWFSMYRDK